MSETATEKADQFLRRFTRELPVLLSEHENQMYGKMLAEKVNELRLAEDKKKQVMADHNNRIKVIETEITRIAVARAKGEELRPVMCGERLHGNVIEIVRIDRAEVVDTRPADLKDLQTTMPGMGMPEIPDGFDEGPRGDGLGSLADRPVEESTGEMSTSSVGDQVYTDANEADPEDMSDVRNCDACGDLVADGAETVVYEGSTIHKECAPADDMPDNIVRPDFTGVPGRADGESEDDFIDRKLRERDEAADDVSTSQGDGNGSSRGQWAAQRERDIAQREKEIAEEKAKPKPTRERSKKANATKGKKKK